MYVVVKGPGNGDVIFCGATPLDGNNPMSSSSIRPTYDGSQTVSTVTECKGEITAAAKFSKEKIVFSVPPSCDRWGKIGWRSRTYSTKRTYVVAMNDAVEVVPY